MLEDIKNRLSHLKGLAQDLYHLCQIDALSNSPVSSAIRNKTEDIFNGLTRVLDKLVFAYFEKNIAPILSTEEKKKREALVRFIGTDTQDKLKNELSKFGVNDLIVHAKLFSLLGKYQPYNNNWIVELRDVQN